MISILTLFLFTFIASYLILFIKYFYSQTKNYPNGPVPIPMIGNIHQLRSDTRHPMESMISLSQKYGSVFTFWVGNNPIVIISDLEIAKKAFSTSSFAGRPQLPFIKLINGQNGNDVLFADYSKSWRCLRNVTHSAVRKYAANENFPIVTSELIDEITEQIIIREGNGNRFNPKNYIQLMLYNIICYSTFGKKYTFKDPEFVNLENISKTMFEFGNRGAIMQFIPISAVLLLPQLNKIYKIFREYTIFIVKKFHFHLKSFDEGVTRDLTDALIAARNEAIAEGKESAKYLTNYNLKAALWDLLFAGVDTTQISLLWMVLFMANYPDIQKRLRKEIEEVIGDQIPVQDDINHCHYLNAFISESLRFRNVLPFSVPHKTTENIDLNGHKIPSNTTVIIHQHFIQNDPKYWKDPQVFDPNRFLDNDHYVSVRPQAFIPFGTGQRRCLGEKLAVINLFLIIVRILQATIGYQIDLPSGPGSADLNPDPNTSVQFIYPKPYEIVLNLN